MTPTYSPAKKMSNSVGSSICTINMWKNFWKNLFQLRNPGKRQQYWVPWKNVHWWNMNIQILKGQMNIEKQGIGQDPTYPATGAILFITN